MNAVDIVKKYYEAFNAQSREGMLALLDPKLDTNPIKEMPE